MAAKADLIEKVAKDIDVKSVLNPLLIGLSENDKKHLFVTNVSTAFIKTGFPLFDYYFGSVINIYDDAGNIVRQEGRPGQAAGTFNLLVAATGGGKTTLLIQIMGNMLRQFPMANSILFDCEERTDIPRCQNITKLPSEYFYSDKGVPRFLIRQGAIGLDTIQEMVVRLYVRKMQHRDQLLTSAGHTDGFGKDVMILPPTIIGIDSITTVLSETFNPDNAKEASDAEKMRGNTEGARDAKTLKGFFKDILPLCKEANIIIYGINHINQNMSMNAFTPVAKQQNFLKQDESIPGGKTMLYYPYNIIKLTAKPSDDFTEETDGFNGHIVMFEPIKSSSNQSGNDRKGLSFEMVFSFKEGFDTLRTMVWYGKTYGFIEGNKNRMRFKGDDSFTFSWKDLPREAKNKPIWESLRKFVYPHLDTHLSYMDLDDHQFDKNVLMY